jgi:hypothetical protein
MVVGHVSLPQHWDLLSSEDQIRYTSLQQELSAPSRRNRRNRSLATFGEVIGAIRQFVVRNDENDWKRAIVCGICWLDVTIGVNTRQLRLLIAKCKSSINGSFQSLGFGFVSTGSDCMAAIVQYFPVLKSNFVELRQWTLRYSGPPVRFVSPAPDTQSDAVPTEMEFTLTCIPDLVHSPAESMLSTENLELNVFDDPMSFAPTSIDLPHWDDPGSDFLKDPKVFDLPGLD